LLDPVGLRYINNICCADIAAAAVSDVLNVFWLKMGVLTFELPPLIRLANVALLVAASSALLRILVDRLGTSSP